MESVAALGTGVKQRASGRKTLNSQVFLDFHQHENGRRPAFHAARNKGWDLAFD
jgi:hypothetical protein